MVFGEAYRGVIPILMVLAMCPPIRFLSTAVGSALLSENHMRYRVVAMAVSTVAVIALNLVLIPDSAAGRGMRHGDGECSCCWSPSIACAAS